MAARATLALVAVLAALPATVGATSKRIVGGQPASASDLPFVAGLEIAGDDGESYLCAGSLIAARWVVTAAHCLVEVPVDEDNSVAVLGSTSLDHETPDQRYRWAQALVAPGYLSGTGGSDVGLIRLARPSGNTQLRLLRPSDSAALYRAGTPAVTAGWGFTEDPLDGGQVSTNQLRSVGVDIVGDSDCERAFADARASGQFEPGTEVCAIAPGRDSCDGDSGGPLMVADAGALPALVGGVSFGIGSGDTLRGDRSCNEGPPGVYSRLGAQSLNAWVRSYVPQVEIDSDVVAPVPGQRIALTAVPRAPQGDGPFGGYDTLAWDLNGDNAFAEAVGQRSAIITARAPASTVAVRATTNEGDAEIRRLRIITQAKSAVSFARAKARVRRGRSVAVRIARVGTGAGSARLRVTGSGVSPRSRKVRFRGDEAARIIRLRALRGGRSRTVTVRLGRFTGDVVGGNRTKLRLRVQR